MLVSQPCVHPNSAVAPRSDDGPGWDRYPEVKAALKPVARDDGVFWVCKEEFFKYFKTVYLCASDMTRFLED